MVTWRLHSVFMRGIILQIKKMQKYFYALLLSFVSFYAVAGSIKGTITDSKNNPLTGVVVTITGAGQGAVSDFDGKYEIAGLAAGTYNIVFTYATYKTVNQSVTLLAGQEATLDIKLLPETTELTDQVVKAAKITNTENSVISEIKNSNTIVSGTSAAQISKTMDRNAADVVKRIPGVTIQNDRFIVVRGLPDRYNTVLLNDASTPSSEADKKAFSFDIIPAGLIDRVLVFKTPSPDLPGDFAGGMIKVYTTSLADKNQLSVSAQVSSREYSTGTNFNYNKPSGTDWLGYDDGKRNIPGIIPDVLRSNDPNYKTYLPAMSKSFGNDWDINSKKTSPDMRFSLALSNVYKGKKIKIGNTLGVTYSNTNTNYQMHRQDWDSVTQNYNYIDQKSTNNVSAGLMDNIGVSIGNSKFEFRNLYNQIGTSSLTVRKSIRDTSIANDVDQLAYAIGYESRATYSTQLTGTHKNNSETRKYTWTLGYNDLFKNQPDLRRIKYVIAGSDTTYRAQVASGVDPINGGGRLYSKLFEKTYSFNHQFTQKVDLFKNFSFEVGAGNYVEYKHRSFSMRQFGYLIKKNASNFNLPYLPVDKIFADTNVDGANLFKIGEATNPYDKYEGENKLIASYLSLKIPVGKKILLFGGARYEYNEQSIKGYINQDTVAITPNNITKFLLPSMNAAYNFSDKSLIRVAYGKTLNRPEFREWAPTYYYDFDELAGVKGSLFKTTATRNKSNIGDTLKVAEIQNFDLRYELYPGIGEMFQIGGFYKSFKNPIQRVIVPGSGSDSRTFTFINADDAYCVGFELDARKNLAFVDKWFGIDQFKNFTLVGNLSLTKSEMRIDSSQIKNAVPKASMQGQSSYIINAGVFYQGEGTGMQGSLLFNVFGPRMFAIGTTNAGGESIGEMPFQSLDFTLSKMFFKRYIINVGVQNLLGSRIVFKKDANRDNKFDAKDVEYNTYYPGRYYTIGVKVKI